MKGLARDRAKRYQTAQAFADDLRAFLESIGNPASELGEIVSKIKPRKADDLPKDDAARAAATNESPAAVAEPAVSDRVVAGEDSLESSSAAEADCRVDAERGGEAQSVASGVSGEFALAKGEALACRKPWMVVAIVVVVAVIVALIAAFACGVLP